MKSHERKMLKPDVESQLTVLFTTSNTAINQIVCPFPFHFGTDRDSLRVSWLCSHVVTFH